MRSPPPSPSADTHIAAVGAQRSAVATVGAAAAIVAAVTALSSLAADFLPAASLPLLFLVGVLVAALRLGLPGGIVASLGAFAAYNFFFIEPVHTLRVAAPADLLLLAVFMLAAATTGWLASRMRDEARTAAARAAALERLAAFTAEIAASRDANEIERLTIVHLAAAAGAAVLLRRREDRLAIELRVPESLVLDAVELQAADRASRRGTRESRTAPGWAGNAFVFVRLADGDAVVGFRPTRGVPDAVLDAMLQQGQLAAARAHLAQAARSALEEAEKANVRAAMLAALSHDLKTPLATILGAASSLRELDGGLSPAARGELASAIEEEAGRLARYVANLLHMTRLKSGIEPNIDWADAGDIAQGAVARAQHAFPAARFAFAAAPEAPLLRTDAVLLEQAVFNVLENAARVSPADRDIAVRVWAADATLRIAVADDGPGVAPGDLARIFDPFFRGAGARPGGTGLGLTIARDIARTLGGTVEVESPKSDGAGTQVVFAFKAVDPAGVP
jgi:two-component system sensor histidine kinase KdpD